jgi:hypothetical protein
MALHRLELHEHPAPPHHEIRQTTVLDSGERIVGTVGNLYVDDDGSRQLRFVDVVTGFGKKHHLVPVEAITGEAPGSIMLSVDEQTIEGAPEFPDPHTAPNDELQRATREHYGYG